MPSAVPFLSRRDVLAGGVALAALGAVVSACDNKSAPKPPPVEQLQGPLEQARHDSALAGAAAAAIGNPPQVAAALTVVANQRAAHASALSAEIWRVAGRLATSSSSETPSPSQAQPAGPPPPPPPVSDVIDALRASADSATRLVGTESGYRAGLLASIAASCTASYTVALVPGGPSI